MAPLTSESIEGVLKSDTTLEQGAEDIAKDITNKVYDIVELCEKLQSPLTSQNVEQRIQGTLLLARVLAQLPKDLLNEQQLNVMTEFYAARLKDNHNVVPAVIEGINALVHMVHMAGVNVVQILQSFFLNTTCQSQTRSDRFKLFNIFKYISERYVADLKAMSGDFIYGIINSTDGERDPRNLDLIFSYMPEFIATYPLLHLSEEMFEILACYFPIDFTPTANDPSSLTRDILSAKLIQCLVASSDFAEWTVDLALDKLSSDLTVAKCDSLELLHQAALKLPPDCLEPYFEKIWLSLKSLILPGSDNQAVLSAALHALSSLLLQAAKTNNTISHNYQTLIFGSILKYLNDINQSLFEPCVRIALICVQGDATFAADKLLNSFLLKLNESSPSLNDEQCARIYHIIAQIFAIICARGEAATEALKRNLCDSIHEHVLKSLDKASTQTTNPNNDLLCSGIRVLHESAIFINQRNRILCYRVVLDLINQQSLDLSDTTCLLIKRLGTLQPIEVQNNFTDVCIRNFAAYTNFTKEKILKNLLTLIQQSPFTESILDLLYAQAFASTIERDVRLLVLKAFNILLEDSDQVFIEKLQHDTDLINKYIQLAKSHDDCNILSEIELGLTLIVQSLSKAEQYVAVTQYLLQLNLQRTTDLYVAKGLLGFLHPDISLDDHFENLLYDVTQFSLKSDSDQTRQVANKLLCSLVNKCDYKKEHNRGALTRVIDKLKEAIKEEKKSAIEILSWLAKGLIMCGSDDAADVVEELSKLLEHPTLGHAASLAFDVISNEYPQLHLPVIKYLFKQKFFHLVLKKLSHKLDTYCEHHLSAFIYVLKMTPHAVLKINIEKIGPVLFNSLNLTNAHTLSVSLRICSNFVERQDEYFLHNLSHLIPACLKLSQFKEAMHVRISALNLLYDITKYPTFAVLPFKLDVVLQLSPALDDLKRLVRKAAVKASNSWHLVGAATDDE